MSDTPGAIQHDGVGDHTAARVIARFLRARGVHRVFALCGGHIMPVWMACVAEGIRIVDVRDERSAVFMAHAHAELTGSVGVALVTAGPGVTNAMTGIANAHVSGAPVLVLSGTPPLPQHGRGALQDLPHVELVRSITRFARTVLVPDLLPAALDAAWASTSSRGRDSGPAYLDVPTDVLTATVSPAVLLDEYLDPPRREQVAADQVSVERAVDVLWSARRPLVISGRGARRAGRELTALLDSLGALYLDTAETKGLVDGGHPAVVTAVRGAVLGEADVVVTVGRRLDFQLAYGSPAVFGRARFVRIGDSPGELSENRRGEVELAGDVAATLRALVQTAGDRPPAVDREWAAAHRSRHLERATAFAAGLRTAPDGPDGRMHPHRLLAALRDALPADAAVIADGGDWLSFARIGLEPGDYLDPGPLGCLGVGTPFGIAAALAEPDRVTVVATGDGALGFSAIELDTAARHSVPLMVVVANNAAWQIEVDDQRRRFGVVAGTALRDTDYAAVARGFGLYAERVERPEQLADAIERCLAHRPSLLDVVVGGHAGSPDSRSGLAVVPDLQAITSWDDAERAWRDTSIVD